MDIDEKIRLEEDRHDKKLDELNGLLRMYENNARESMGYVDRNINQAAMSGINPDSIISYEESRKNINPYAKQIEDIKNAIKQENDLHNERMAFLSQQKQAIEQKNVEDRIALEQERQQRELALIDLQQEVNKVENERLEIEKKLRTISMKTIGAVYSQKIAEKYPEVYQRFYASKDQFRRRLISFSQIADLKERFSKVSDDLKFYKSALPIFESYYQRYEEVRKEMEQQKASERDIYNSMHAQENERLSARRSLYTAHNLGNRTIPQQYQGMTREQVDAALKQKQVEENARKEAQLEREKLIGMAIRRNLMISNNEHLSDVQIKNLSGEFIGYSNEELQNYIATGKKKEIVSTESFQQPMENMVVPEVKPQTSISNNYERNLINYIESTYSIFGKVSQILSVTGYPDSTYEVQFEDGNIHQVIISQEEKEMIRNQMTNPVEVISSGGKNR